MNLSPIVILYVGKGGELTYHNTLYARVSNPHLAQSDVCLMSLNLQDMRLQALRHILVV